MGFGAFWGLGFGVWGLLGFRVEGLGLGVWGLLGFRVWGLGIRVLSIFGGVGGWQASEFEQEAASMTLEGLGFRVDPRP